jgi:hypothetical protein
MRGDTPHNTLITSSDSSRYQKQGMPDCHLPLFVGNSEEEREVFFMKEQNKERRFHCDECKRAFDLRLLHGRDKKNYCPTCYVDQYDTWECTRSHRMIHEPRSPQM